MASHALQTSARKSRNVKLLASTACAALALAGWLPSPASAASYTATNSTQLINAITAANASADPSSTITLTNSVTLPSNTSLAMPTKSITIDTQGFVLSGTTGAGNGTITFFSAVFPSVTMTLNGALVGGNSAGIGNPGGGLSIQSLAGSTGQVINNGSITGGNATVVGKQGAVGAAMFIDSTLVNNGTITGGIANAYVRPAGSVQGSGVSLGTGSALINNAGATVLGGNSQGIGAGAGLYMNATGGANTATNYGTIRGGVDLNGAVAGNAAVRGLSGTASTSSLTNFGLLEGGSGAAAIGEDGTWNLAIVNSGTIRAGAGQSNAIVFGQNAASTSTLELQAGSIIQGNVIGSALAANDTLRLGGATNASFDVSAIGAAAQYRNFDKFEKTGTSTWILTGTGTATTPWTIQQGTLQLGDGTATGSIIGNIVNNGALTFNRSDALTYNGAISGTGSVSQIGTGTTILGGASSYTGGSFLNTGTLSVASEANLGDVAGALSFNGGVLQVTGTGFTGTARTINWGGGGFDIADAANVFTVGQPLSGTGSLTKLGAGTLALTTSDTYTGGTTISGGTLQLGSGGTAGGIVGNVTNNGALAFNRSDAVTFGGVISGTGSVSQLGGGTTTLGGVNTYAGGTTITAGRLTGSASSFGSGAIADNAALVIDQPTEAAFANAINGTGSLTKQGAGRLNYTGTGSLSGVTTVAAGLLSVNGSLANSAVTVLSGASLGGTGTVGATSVQSGGTIAPGNSIGTLQVNGAYTQASGSTYQVEVDPNTNASDRIAVTGTATLQSGAGLNVTKSVAGDYRLGTVYTVLSATGGRTGTYTLSGNTTGATAFLGLRDSYDANNAYLTVVQIRDPAEAAQTPNQQAVAENLPAPVLPPVLNLPDDTSARAAFDQLSAQALASAKGALVSNGLYVRDATLDRLRDVRCRTDENQTARRAACESEQPSLWAQGFGGWGGVSGNANASGLNHTAAGMLAGFDLPIMDWRAGLFAGFSNADFHLTSGPAGGESTDYHLGAYAGTNWHDISLSLGASYTWNTIRTDRSVAFGTFTDRLQALYNAGVTQVFAEAGYGMEMWGITLEPFANLAYLNLRTDGFTEVGGAAALTSQADTIENVISTFGIRPSTTVDLGSFPLTLRGMAGWRHTFGTVTPTSTVAFAGGNDFTISGAPIARDAMALEAGVDFAVADNISAGLSYGGQLSNRTTDQTARGTIRIAF